MKKTLTVLCLIAVLSGYGQKIVRRSLIYDRKTPAAALNSCAGSINYFLSMAHKGQLKKTACRKDWLDYPLFPSWAIWGYVCPDSKFKGDEKTLDMLRRWLENFREKIINDPKMHKLNLKGPVLAFKRIPFRPSIVAMTVNEIKLRPEIEQKIGKKLVAEVDKFITEIYKQVWQQDGVSKDKQKIINYANMATHDVTNMVYGYIFTGNKGFMDSAVKTMHALDYIQKPNGMFPYRYQCDGVKDHCEYESMYYRCKDVQSVFVFWWFTKDSLARKMLVKSANYNPLNMEPPYFINAGCEVWWKVSWRTFWPGQIAMVAAVARDGETATIARKMARDNVSKDRFDLVLGSLAYHLMADVKSKPVRNNYVVKDPDIRGIRLRYGNWSSTFTGLSYIPTRYSAIITGKGQRRPWFDALIMVRPYIRVRKMAIKERYETDYCSLGPAGLRPELVVGPNYGAAAGSYRLMTQSTTWRKDKKYAPCENTEIWLMTDRGSVGLIQSEFTADFKALEYMQAFKFKLHKGAKLSMIDKNNYRAGSFELKIWLSDLPVRVVERARLSALNPNDYTCFQLVLSQSNRSPENEAEKNPQDKTLKTCKEVLFRKGQKFYALVSVSPEGKSVVEVKLVKDGFQADVAGKKYVVTYRKKLQVKVY